MPQLHEICNNCSKNHLDLLRKIISRSKRKGDCVVCYLALDHQCRPKLQIRGKNYFVSRLIMHIVKDFDLDSTLSILHNDEICKSKACIELSHLRVGTYSENLRDSIKKHGAFTTGKFNPHCKRGHLRIPENLLMNGKGCLICSREQKQRNAKAIRNLQ